MGAINLDAKVVECTEQIGETIASWTNNRLVYQNANLKTIVRDINLYSKDRIIIASSKLEEHELSIAFDVSEIHQMLDNLTEILPVKIDKSLPGTIVISPIEEQIYVVKLKKPSFGLSVFADGAERKSSAK